MLKIRLQRAGRSGDPSFRLILTDSRKPPKSGKYLELLGSYDARKKHPQFKGERIKFWLGKGAKISETVNNLLTKAKII
jgi:small subunit ribosomal protein S16